MVPLVASRIHSARLHFMGGVVGCRYSTILVSLAANQKGAAGDGRWERKSAEGGYRSVTPLTFHASRSQRSPVPQSPPTIVHIPLGASSVPLPTVSVIFRTCAWPSWKRWVNRCPWSP